MALFSSLPKITITVVVLISSFLCSNAEVNYIGQSCYNAFGKYDLLSNYETNIDKSITQLTSLASKAYFDTTTTGIGKDKVNAVYYCRYDISLEACSTCVASTANNVTSCFRSVENLIVYSDCAVHYSNRSIFSVMEDLPQLYVYSIGDDVVDNGQYNRLLATTITSLISDASSGFSVSSRYFATTTAKYSFLKTLYALAQCNEDITSSECSACLRVSFGNFTIDHPQAIRGQIFTPSCRLSYKLTSEVLSRPWSFSADIIDRTPESSFPPSLGPSSSFPQGLSPPSSFPQSLSPPSSFPQSLTPPSSFPRGLTPFNQRSTGTRSSSINGALLATVSCIVLALKQLL